MAATLLAAFCACDSEAIDPILEPRAGACGPDELMVLEVYTEGNLGDLTDVSVFHGFPSEFDGEPICLLWCYCHYDPATPECSDGAEPIAVTGNEAAFIGFEATFGTEDQVDADDCEGLAEDQDEGALELCWNACILDNPEPEGMICCLPAPGPELVQCVDEQFQPVPCATNGGSGSSSGSGSGSG